MPGPSQRVANFFVQTDDMIKNCPIVSYTLTTDNEGTKPISSEFEKTIIL